MRGTDHLGRRAARAPLADRWSARSRAGTTPPAPRRTALEAVAASLDPEVAARIDPEDFYDFQVNRPTIRLVEGQTREIDWPANTLLSVARPDRRARSRPAERGRAQPPLAHLRRLDRLRRRAAGRRDGRHPGRADRGRRPHPPGADHGPGVRPGAGRAPRPEPLELRGADRDRRRGPRRLPAPRHRPRRASGRPSPTTWRRCPTRRRRSRCFAAWRG